MSVLRQAIEELRTNERQWEAFTTTGHCAVLAPPGSGKTKLLTTRLAYDLVSGEVEAPHGAACITMTNEAALVLRRRLRELGVGRRPNLFVGTVHGFALARVVAPLAKAAGREDLAGSRVASDRERTDAFQAAFAACGFRPDERDEARTTMNKARQLMDLTGNRMLGGEPIADLARRYQSELAARNRFDFHDLVRHALDLVSQHSWVAAVLAAAHPRVYVDEYQDLPPGLDRLVRCLALRPGRHATLFAVGDPDQAIFGFAGTEPDLLNRLAEEDSVQRVPLEKNYRSAQGIIDVSVRALGEDRTIVGDRDGGSVTLHVAPGGEDAQARRAVELVVEARKAGVAHEQIAIVSAWGQDRNRVSGMLRDANIPVFARTDQHWSTTTLTMLLEGTASWAARRADAGVSLDDLLDTWGAVLRGASDHATLSGVVRVLLDARPNDLAHDFVEAIVDVALSPMADDPGSSEDARELQRMRRALSIGGPLAAITVSDVGDRARAVGRVMAATIHAAKGLEFEVVIIVGADNACLPGFSPTEQEHQEARRKFYVSLTRAKEQVHIVHTDRRVSRRGRWYDVTPSPFIRELGL